MRRIRQSGMSLVEVMVAVAIGLIGILIITQAYIAGENFNRSTVGETGGQMGGAVALYMIERELRNAGYGIADTGALRCGELYWYYDPNYSQNISAGSPLPRLVVAPVVIRTSASGAPDELTVLYSRSARMATPATVQSFVAGAAEVTLIGTSLGFAANDLVILSGASGCTLRQVTAVIEEQNKLQLNPGPTARFNPPGWGAFPTTYANGDLVFNLGNAALRTYTVSGGRLLATDVLLQAGGAAGATAALMEGIVDLRAQYGKDNGIDNGTVAATSYVANDGQVDQFSSTVPANAAEWQQVLSVRLGILVRIGTYEKPSAAGICDATTTPPTWAGGTFTAIDVTTTTSEDRCYRYRVFETIVPLRNMIWGLAS
ncbi:MAG: PilW family protein [Burkholderiales bacterium]|nr:PilW family protein [Burkholderiales bacterium]